jgi:hypothetical protein
MESINTSAEEQLSTFLAELRRSVLVTPDQMDRVSSTHRLSIYRSTKRGKEKSLSDGHCEKEMDDHLLVFQ